MTPMEKQYERLLHTNFNNVRREFPDATFSEQMYGAKVRTMRNAMNQIAARHDSKGNYRTSETLTGLLVLHAYATQQVITDDL